MMEHMDTDIAKAQGAELRSVQMSIPQVRWRLSSPYNTEI